MLYKYTTFWTQKQEAEVTEFFYLKKRQENAIFW